MKMSNYVVSRKMFTGMCRRCLPAAAGAVGRWGVSAPTASAETAQRCPESQLAACCRHPRNDRATAAAARSKLTRHKGREPWMTIERQSFNLIKNPVDPSEVLHFLHDFGVILPRWWFSLIPFHSALPVITNLFYLLLITKLKDSSSRTVLIQKEYR